MSSSLASSSEVSQGDDFLNDAHESESPTESLVPEITISSSLASSSEVAMDQGTSIGVMQETEAESFFSTSELSEGDDFVIDAVQAETEYFDSDPAAICCLNLDCKCGKKLRYGKNQKAVPCSLESGFNRMHSWTYHCSNCSLGQNFNACSFCLLDKGFMSAFNQFNSSNMVKNLGGDKSLGFYQALKPLHCVHIISIVHDIFREQWPLIPISDICCIDMGHGRGQMAMLMARVFGCAVGFDVQQDMNKIVIAALSTYCTLSDRVLLMQCDLLRFGSFNG